MIEQAEETPAPLMGTVLMPLLGVRFELDSGQFDCLPEVRVSTRESCPLLFMPWDDVPSSDNERLAEATHVLEIRGVTLQRRPDGPRRLFVSERTQATIESFVALLTLEAGSLVTYAEMAVLSDDEDFAGSAHFFLSRDFAGRLDATSTFEPRTLTSAHLSRAACRWEQLPNRHPSLRTAIQRLLMSWQRDQYSHDAIVDYCVAIEALLGEGSNEIVGRISLRGAAMLASVGWTPSSDTAKGIRDIYTYRSQVVHGIPGPYKKELITIGDGPPVHAVRFALAVLIDLLNIFFDHSDLAPTDIDAQYIFAAFDSNR